MINKYNEFVIILCYPVLLARMISQSSRFSAQSGSLKVSNVACSKRISIKEVLLYDHSLFTYKIFDR
jgi:hypothetical protein